MAIGHSSIGPSGAERWMNCPGSVALSATLLPSKPSIHAVEGTVAHGLLELYMKGELNAIALLEKVGDVVTEQGFDIEVTEEMVNAIFAFHDEVEADRKTLTRPAKVTGTAEGRVCAKSVDKELWGTADYILYQPGNKLFVYDFKYGKGKVVEADENKQMALYALGVFDSLGLEGGSFNSIELVIIQPRAPHIEGGVRRWETNIKWLQDFRNQARNAVKATRLPNAPIVAGTWCQWCPAKAQCPEKYALVQREAAVVFGAPTVTPLPNVRLMPVEKLSAALKYEDLINSWFEAVRSLIKEKLEAGEEVPGWKLVDKKTNRQWVDEAEVIAKFAPLLGESKLYDKPKLLSPAKLEKIVGKDEVAPLTFKPVAGKSVAPDNDPRPSLASAAAEAAGVFAAAEAPKEDDLLAELAAAPEPKKEVVPQWPV